LKNLQAVANALEVNVTELIVECEHEPINSEDDN
jgi:hypothetical protein